MPNDGLLELQQRKRDDSIERVSWAVQYLRDLEGIHCRITAAKLANITELSRATMYKAHIRSVWDEKWNVEANSNNNLFEEGLVKETETLKKQVLILEQKLRVTEEKHSKLSKSIEIEKSRANVYRHDFEELKERHQKLLHHNLILLRKIHLHGIDISDLAIPDLEK